MAEAWKPVAGFPRYEVSDQGRVRSNRVLNGSAAGDGYRKVILCRPGEQAHTYVHSLVLETFVGPRPPGMYACHNDGDRGNNALANLRWDTPSANNLDQLKHGTNFERNKTHCRYGHHLAHPNLVRSEWSRRRRKCMACNRARAWVQRYPADDFQAVGDSYYEEILDEKEAA